MFDDVDMTIQSLLTSELGIGIGHTLPFDLSFSLPGKDFKAVSNSRVTLDVYLYDIREDRDLRQIEPQLKRNAAGEVQKLYPPARIKLSYCITAWSPASQTAGLAPENEEHKLLGQVLAALLRYPTIPSDSLYGSLKDSNDPNHQLQPVLTTVALPDNMRANRDFWNAVGGALRPALDYNITISMPYQAPAAGVQMTSAQFSLSQLPQNAPAPARFVIAGTVWNVAQTPTPLAGAWVRVQETGQTEVTDVNGQFRIGQLTAGTYTVSARAANFADAVSGPLAVPRMPPPQGSPAPAFGYYDVQMTPS